MTRYSYRTYLYLLDPAQEHGWIPRHPSAQISIFWITVRKYLERPGTASVIFQTVRRDTENFRAISSQKTSLFASKSSNIFCCPVTTSSIDITIAFSPLYCQLYIKYIVDNILAILLPPSHFHMYRKYIKKVFRMSCYMPISLVVPAYYIQNTPAFFRLSVGRPAPQFC